MKMVLRSLELHHFKCFPTLHIDFHESLTSIYGDNATGKTTVYDALTWLLFDKDSAGNARPDIKPHGMAAGVMPTVTAVLDVDGVPITLRKSLREKWEKPRGSVTARYAGDTRDYFVDDVPCKESEFKRQIAALIDEEKFRLLTDVWAVTTKMHWKERRDLLAEVCGLPDDAELLAGAPQFAELVAQLGRRTVDGYKAALVQQRKGQNASLNALPVRIDECSRMAAELEGIDFVAARRESDRLQAESDRIQGELVRLDNSTLAAQAKNERDALKNQLAELDAENAAHRTSQYVPVEDETPRLQTALTQAQQVCDRLTLSADREKKFIQDGEARLDSYRARWRAIDVEEFTDTTCPTCHQPFPAEQIDKARAAFATHQQQRKDALLEDSKLVKQDIIAAQERLAAAGKTLQAARSEAQQAQAALDAYTPPIMVEPEDLPNYAHRRDSLRQALKDAEKRLSALDSDTAAERASLQAALADVMRAKQTSDAVLAKEHVLADTRQRVAELNAEQRTAAAEVEQLDRAISLCEDFARYRVQRITDDVNRRFRLTRWRLFTEQVNGGLADCCDPMDMNGSTFTGTNDAMKINIGMDIIDTLSDHYGLRVPLFVDNAESVTHLQPAGTQVVRLVVSEADKELRIE